MAKVLVVTAATDVIHYPNAKRTCHRVLELAEQDVHGVHQLTSSPVDADLILFCEHDGAGPYFEDTRRHPYVKNFPEKCCLISQIDRPVAFLPGLYASLERRWAHRSWARSAQYVGIDENPHLQLQDYDAERLYLSSFVGYRHSHRVRQKLFQLRDSRSFLIDSSPLKKIVRQEGWRAMGEKYPSEQQQYRSQFVESIRDSCFVLCPRGVGTSTWRLFQTMICGRAPVIISDQWVPIDGPNWDQFTISIPQRDVVAVGKILRERESEAVEMGRRARVAWERWFSRTTVFHNFVETCLDIRKRHGQSPAPRSWPMLQMLTPFHATRYLKTRFRLLRERRRLIL